MNKKIIISILLVVVMLASAAPIGAFAAEDENLVSGMRYTVTYSSPIDKAYPNLAYDDPGYALTDGKTAKSGAYNDPAFVNFYRGTYATVEFAFETPVFVNGYSAGFFGNAYGILIPRETSLSVSEDGENWYTCISERDDSRPARSVKGRNELTQTVGEYYKALYVRFTFACDVFCYCDEIKVFGTRETVGAASHGYDEINYPDEFTSPDTPILQGTRHVVLIYNSFTDNNTEEALLPYAAYLDRTGKIVSADMFDSFLFLPHRYSTPEGKTCKEGWEDYLETTLGFGETPRNLAALENAAGTVSAATGEDVKYNVFLSIPENHQSGDLFGVIDGETVRLTSKENRLKAVEWFADLTIRRFNECNFKHLNLVGLYWFNETILFAETPYDFETVKEYNAYVHSKGYASIWIPYYCSPGFNYWQELGFDCAALQSGWAFPRAEDAETGVQLKGMTDDTMAVAKKYGMGLELEVASSATDRFADYIWSAAKAGCMKNGVSMYYQEALPGVFYKFWKSDRTKYDLLHSYINATYEQYAPEPEIPGTLLIQTDSKENTGNLRFTDRDSAKSAIRVASRRDPEHGTLSLDRDGFFVYEPESGYSGGDSFEFTLTDGFNVSETYRVEITVSPDVIRLSGLNSALKADRSVAYNGEGTTGASPDLAGLIEIAVNSSGEVIAVSSEGNMPIPENGFVVSACGTAAQSLTPIASVGAKVSLDVVTKSVCPLESGGTGPETSAPAESEISQTEPVSAPAQESGSGGNTVLYIVLAAAAAVIAAAAVVIKKFKFFKGEEKK